MSSVATSCCSIPVGQMVRTSGQNSYVGQVLTWAKITREYFSRSVDTIMYHTMVYPVKCSVRKALYNYQLLL